MPIALITAMLLAPLPSAPPFTSPPPPVSAREGVGDDVRLDLYRLYREVNSAAASGEISPAAAKGLSVRVERLRRQLVRMGNIVGPRQRVRLRARIDAVRAQLAASRVSSGGGEGRS